MRTGRPISGRAVGEPLLPHMRPDLIIVPATGPASGRGWCQGSEELGAGRRQTRRDEKGQGGPGPQVGGRAPPHAGRRHNLHGQQGSPISGGGRLGSTGGNEGSGGLSTSPVRKQVPSPGR